MTESTWKILKLDWKTPGIFYFQKSGNPEKEYTDWVKERMEYEVEGCRARGRPKRTLREVLQKDCQAHKLNRDMDHSRWKMLLKFG